MSIMRNYLTRKYCKKCVITEVLKKRVSEQNSKIASAEQEQKLLDGLRTRSEKDAIVYISPKTAERQFFVTQTELYNGDSSIYRIRFQGYVTDISLKQVATLYCTVCYNNKGVKYVKGILIDDITVDTPWERLGYGSIMLEALTRYARGLGAQYLRGNLSWKDIGRPEDKDRPEKLDKLTRFYQKNGFTVVEDKRILKSLV